MVATDIQSFAMNSIDLAITSIGADRRQWIHICPKGRLDTRDSRGPYFLKNAEKVIENIQSIQGNAKMLVDYDHQSVAGLGIPAVAAGWIEGLQNRANGIWALVQWTEKAVKHIVAREYRYLSPVLCCSPDSEVLSIKNVALTNSPNLHELTALMRMENPIMNTAAKNDALGNDTTDFTDAEMQDIRQLLKLPQDANPAAVIAAIKALLQQPQSAVPDPSQYVRIGDFERAVAEANSLRQGIGKHEAMTYVDDKIRSGKLVPAFRTWGVDLCTVNKPAFDQFLERTSSALAPLFTSIVPNAYDAGRHGGQLSVVEAEVCERMGLTPEQFKAGN